MKRNIIVAMVLLLMPFAKNSVAQKQSECELQSRFAHVAFSYPIGSDGYSSKNFRYSISMSLLNGNLGGINGFSLNGLVGFLQKDSKGVAISSIGNTNFQRFGGIQIGGVFNSTRLNSEGIQIAGIFNRVGKQSHGLQIGGVCNITREDHCGVQIAGIYNQAAQQIAGVQLGVVNKSKKLKGLQLGVVNKTENLKGVQFGIVNICDSVSSGLPIGLISLVKNGYYRFELLIGETINNTICFKAGTQKLYSIFAVGIHYHSGNTYWTPGMGLGFRTGSGKKTETFLDAICFNVNNQYFMDQTNLLNQLRFSFSHKLNGKCCLTWGPTANVLFSHREENDHHRMGSQIVSYWLFRNKKEQSDLKIWPGLSLGLSF